MSHPLTLDARELEVEPGVRPERYEGVRTRRAFAFLIDFAAVLFLMLVAYVVIAVLGIFTLGLLWFLLPAVWPVVAILYSVLALGGPHSATPGHALHGDRDADRPRRAPRLWNRLAACPWILVLHRYPDAAGARRRPLHRAKATPSRPRAWNRRGSLALLRLSPAANSSPATRHEVSPELPQYAILSCAPLWRGMMRCVRSLR